VLEEAHGICAVALPVLKSHAAQYALAIDDLDKNYGLLDLNVLGKVFQFHQFN
jgi:hypothetical protein